MMSDNVVELHPKIILDSALKYASQGYRILPLHSIKGGICTCGNQSCKSPGKHPLTQRGANEASSDEIQIKGWWSQWPTANIGIAMGDHGTIALDVDTRNNGHLTWESILQANGQLPETATQRTGNGWHYLFVIDEKLMPKIKGKLGQGIDVKANGYIVAEPSIHHSGRRYSWDDGLDLLQGFNPSRAPVWLEQMLCDSATSAPSTASLGNITLPVQLTEAASALEHLDANDYNQWIEAGMALHATGLGDLAYQVWVDWSVESPKFDHKDQRRRWMSFRTDKGGVSIKTIFARAQAVGWVNPLSVKQSQEEKLTPDQHPFANYLPYALGKLEPDEFIFDDILIAGVTLLAGFTGIGKTTALVPLMARAAHLCSDAENIRPILRRKVIYVSEDPKQVVRVLTSMRIAGHLTASDQELAEWFKIVPAKRMDAESIVKVREAYEKLSHRNIDPISGIYHDTKPVVVLDTSNATIELENESDNSEVGKAVATLKSELGGIPLIIVAHLAKTLKKADISDMTSRGAGAWEGDVNQVLYMTKEDDGARWLDVSQAKHRFVAAADGIVFRSYNTEIKGKDLLGRDKNLFMMHCQPEMIEKGGRKAMQDASKRAAEQSKANAEQIIRSAKRNSVLSILGGLRGDEYKTKNEVSDELGGHKRHNFDLIDEMLNAGDIELFTPISKRARQHVNGYRLAGSGARSYQANSNGE
jgi:hypothetical protein